MLQEDEEDLFGEEDSEDVTRSQQSAKLCLTTGRTRRTGAGVNIAWQAELQTFLTDLDDQIRGFKERDCVDYCFLRNAARDVSQPVLVARDRRTSIYIAHAVPFKRAGVEWIAKQMLRDVRKCGYHGRVAFRTDGEPAILDLMGEVARLR